MKIEDIKQLIALSVISLISLIGVIALLIMTIKGETLMMLNSVISACIGAVISILTITKNANGEIVSDSTEQALKISNEIKDYDSEGVSLKEEDTDGAI
jgi:mannitol-specific phosphotransferase system IIBC component